MNDAYAACLDIARRHYENFPVASGLVPAALRPHVAAIYAFARGADDIADEPGRAPDERLALLDEWAAHLREPPRTFIFEAIGETRARFDLPLQLFDDLLSAFRQDVYTTHYDSWEQVLDYCRRSANPVGRLVLRLAGVRSADADRWSDAVCTALQLTNFWQDLATDWQRGRLYVPTPVWTAAGAKPADLDRRVMSTSWKVAIGECVATTRRLFAEGRPVCDVLPGRLRYELRGTWLGGTRILDKIEAHGCDVLRHRPKLTVPDAMMIGWKALTWPAIHRSITHS